MNLGKRNAAPLLNFDVSPILALFNQLPFDYKQLVVNILKKELVKTKSLKQASWQTLKGSVVGFEHPFEPVANVEWEATQ
jgi:hypothetical protein